MNNITVRKAVKTNASIIRCLLSIDSYFDCCPVAVTSGVREPIDQMRIIMEKCKRHGINNALFSEYVTLEDRNIAEIVDVNGQKLYWWQRAWSKLLNLGDIVNPPISAEVLFDYFKPESTVNGKGRVIEPSPHFKGTAFDLTGLDLNKIVERLATAKTDGKAYVKGYLKEEVNNAVHVDIYQMEAA